jgi:UDP-galactopyranose mutase
VTQAAPGLCVVVPHLSLEQDEAEIVDAQRALLGELARERGIRRPLLWFYTPMAVPLAAALDPSLVVYDCMDELSHFKGAPPALRERERQLFAMAHLVFTGGQRLYEAKRDHHPHVHAFPSSVDAAHFARARRPLADPADQAAIPSPRVGFFGVIDERMDLDLLARVADERPAVQLVMLGPIVKIDPESLPRRPNLHWLGAKSYAELPAYLSRWDVAMMPFALNESTEFISPTKTLEYMAAGKPIVSTAIRDVVVPYGERGVVRIADATTFAAAIDAALAESGSAAGEARRRAADEMVAATSWDRTWHAMTRLIEAAEGPRAAAEGSLSCSMS